MGYPILLNLHGQRVVVVGSGKVGTRKVIDLLNEGAMITVISPTLHFSLEGIRTHPNMDIRQTEYTAGMLAEIRPMLVFACTDSPEVNEQVADEARALGILVNRTDDGKAGDFMNMAKIERGEISIGLATGGVAPALAVYLREKLEAIVGEEYAVLARLLGELRPLVLATIPADQRAGLWQAVVRSQALDCLRNGDEAAARAIINKLIAETNNESNK